MKTKSEKNINLIKMVEKTITTVAILMSICHLITYIFGLMPAMQQRSMFLFFTTTIILLEAILGKLKENKIDLLSIFLLIGSTVACAYVFMNWYDMSFRVISPQKIDIILGILIIATVIECTRKKLGMALPIITLGFVFYALLSSYMPEIIKGSSSTVQRLVSYLTMETSGIYGMVLGTASKYIFIFVIFGAFLQNSGASEFFLDFTDCLFGRTKGGSAKVDVVSSGFFGMISGSAVANVMTTGPITIPMMKKNGFSSNFAGTVTAIAGTGGQLVPPIMGTAAFIMAETINVPYSKIIVAAIIPGIFYYMCLWIMINFHCNKMGIKGTKEKRDWKPIFKKGYMYLIPIIFLIVSISILQWSPVKAGVWGIALIIIASQFNKERRMGIKQIMKSLEDGARSSVSVGIACAVAGIVIGILSITGLGIKFSNIMLQISGDSLMLLLVLTMIAGLILGMGMTTTSVYIVLSVLVAPALVTMGVKPIAAHLFVFYFGILSCITPPVSTASFAAASIAEVPPMKLGMYISKKAIPIYYLPFLFVLNPALLMDASPLKILVSTIFAVIIMTGICAAIEGYFKSQLGMIQRIMLMICGAMFLNTSVIVEIVSVIIVLSIGVFNFNKSRQEESLLKAS